VQEEQGGESRAGYGEELLERVGCVLGAEHSRSFSYRSLANMRQFYLTYPNLSTLRTELNWSHYRILMRLAPEVREFYERGAIAGRWSSRELDRQINFLLAARTVMSRKPIKTMKQALAERPLLP
jgi:hypothetical protein